MKSTKTMHIIHNNADLSVHTAHILKDKLSKAGYLISDTFDDNTELIICIGGDGTFLRALRSLDFPETPVIGINTGHLGFFTEITPNEIDAFIDKYKSKDYSLQEFIPVEATICTHNDCKYVTAINEIVIKGNKSRTIHLKLSLNQNLIQQFSGDGIIVSTSTGSTAYNYSAGGSILDPSLSVLQITPLSPINTTAYRSFTSSIILPSDANIEIVPEYQFENALLIVSDGVEHRHNGISRIDIRLSNHKIHMIRLKGYEFWNRVTSKFL